VLVNPCNCKGTSEYVHIKCLQDWISSKVKKKVNPSATCFYWKKLNCEVCKVPLPDLVEVNNQKLELVPILRPPNPYIILERVFYDKAKESGDNSKMMILLSVPNESIQIKLVMDFSYFLIH
jgi:Protein involved in mRNA turnover and stability